MVLLKVNGKHFFFIVYQEQLLLGISILIKYVDNCVYEVMINKIT